MKPSDSDSPRSDAKSPSEPPINTIEGTMRDELEKILRSEFYVNEHDNCDDSCSKKWHSDQAYKRAVASIINLVDKELPTMITFRQGYNRAISEMRAKLKGDK